MIVFQVNLVRNNLVVCDSFGVTTGALRLGPTFEERKIMLADLPKFVAINRILGVEWNDLKN